MFYDYVSLKKIKKPTPTLHKLHLTKQPVISLSLSLSLSSMQRQSLGSPVSKLHSHGGGSSKDADTPITDIDSNRIEDDDEEHKTTKLHRQSLSFTLSPPPNPEKFVHVIPILTLLCFLILYLCSHSPSQSGTTLLPSHQRPPLLSSNYLY